MRVVIQRVERASLTADKVPYSAISRGLLVLAGFENADNSEDLEWVAAKLSKLRIFDDQEGVMNCSVNDIGGEVMVVSQFTLMAATKKGNRPSYIRAAGPEVAIPLYKQFLDCCRKHIDCPIATGVFGADMQIELVNNGPVTIIIDSKNRE